MGATGITETSKQFSSDVSETINWFDDANNSNQLKWEDKLTSMEHDAIKDFTDMEYDGYFAKIYDTKWDDISVFDQPMISALYDALSDYELKKPITVYRNADTKIFGGDGMTYEQIKEFEGKTLHNNGFLSTSAISEAGAQYGTEGTDVKIAFKLPKGKGIGAYVGKKGLSYYDSGEKEFLLNNNAFFKVKKVSKPEKPGYPIKVVMEWVGQSKDQIFKK